MYMLTYLKYMIFLIYVLKYQEILPISMHEYRTALSYIKLVIMIHLPKYILIILLNIIKIYSNNW
jgi:hypothetical protein